MIWLARPLERTTLAAFDDVHPKNVGMVDGARTEVGKVSKAACFFQIALMSPFLRSVEFFIENLIPGLAGAAWACSCNDFDWIAAGFDGRKLGHLLMQASGIEFGGDRR